MKETLDFRVYREDGVPPDFIEALSMVETVRAAYKLKKFNAERAAQLKAHPADPNPMMAVLSTDSTIKIMSRKCCRKHFGAAEWDNEFDSIAMVGEDDLPIIFRSRDLLALGEDEYIVGPVVACECDENGNEASLAFGSLFSSYTYQRENLVTLNVDGVDVKAFKL